MKSKQLLKPFLENVKVKPFKIFTAIHNSINLVGSEVTHFNQ